MSIKPRPGDLWASAQDVRVSPPSVITVFMIGINRVYFKRKVGVATAPAWLYPTSFGRMFVFIMRPGVVVYRRGERFGGGAP